MDKLKSRKFWVSVAAMLAGVGTALAGYTGGSEALAMIGVLCTALSAGIYAFSEAYVDAAGAVQVSAVIDAEETEGE